MGRMPVPIVLPTPMMSVDWLLQQLREWYATSDLEVEELERRAGRILNGEVEGVLEGAPLPDPTIRSRF